MSCNVDVSHYASIALLFRLRDKRKRNTNRAREPRRPEEIGAKCFHNILGRTQIAVFLRLSSPNWHLHNSLIDMFWLRKITDLLLHIGCSFCLIWVSTEMKCIACTFGQKSVQSNHDFLFNQPQAATASGDERPRSNFLALFCCFIARSLLDGARFLHLSSHKLILISASFSMLIFR